MSKIPKAVNFLCDHPSVAVSEIMRDFAKLHVEAALKAATIVLDTNNDGDYIEHPTQEKILNAYSLTKIQ